MLPLLGLAAEEPAQLLGQCGGVMQAIAIQGHYAYIGEGLGLTVLDIANPAQPKAMAKLTMPELKRVNQHVLGVAVSGNFAYVVDGASLRVVDVTDPAAPRLRGVYQNAGEEYRGVAVSGSLVCLAAAKAGLVTVDVSNPDQPQRKGGVALTDFAESVAIDGQRAYVAAWGKGLQVINLSDPAHPAIVGAYDTPGVALKVTLAGQTAYVADQLKGVAVLDVTPTTPTLKWTIRTGDAALDIKTSGSLVAVACRAQGVKLYDASQPTTPTLTGTADTQGQAKALAIQGDLIGVADETSVRFADASQPDSPVFVGAYTPPVYATDLAVSWDWTTKRYWAFVASETGLGVVDLANPQQPAQQAFYPMPAPAKCLALLNPGRQIESVLPVPPPYALVSDVSGVYQRPGARGLWIFKVNKPTSPTLVANYQPLGDVEKIVVNGMSGYPSQPALALLAEGSKGLELVDVTTPASPTRRGVYVTTGTVTDVAVSSQTALLAAGLGGLKILDITNPTSPTLVASYYGAGEVCGVDLVGTTAYVAGRTRLQVLDLSNPTSPTLARNFNHFGWSKMSNMVLGQLVRSGRLSDRVLLTDDGDYLQVADPASPNAQLAAATPVPFNPAYDASLPNPDNKYLLGGESSALVIDADRQLALDADNDGGGLVALRLNEIKNALRLDWTKFD